MASFLIQRVSVAGLSCSACSCFPAVQFDEPIRCNTTSSPSLIQVYGQTNSQPKKSAFYYPKSRCACVANICSMKSESPGL